MSFILRMLTNRTSMSAGNVLGGSTFDSCHLCMVTRSICIFLSARVSQAHHILFMLGKKQFKSGSATLRDRVDKWKGADWLATAKMHEWQLPCVASKCRTDSAHILDRSDLQLLGAVYTSDFVCDFMCDFVCDLHAVAISCPRRNCYHLHVPCNFVRDLPCYFALRFDVRCIYC
jgi:hypothetical protein